jgi:hypothetical protein
MDRERDALAPPEEFPLPAPELTPPPEEFPPVGEPAEEDGASRRHRRKKLFYGAAAAALVLLLAPGNLSSVPQPDPGETVAPVPGIEATAEPGPGAEPTPEPGAETTPEPAPEPAPEPTAEPEPGCEILYYCFSSANYAKLRFTVPEAFESVELELWEPELDLQAAAYELGPEEIAKGELDLSLADAGDLYMEHMAEYQEKDTWPEVLELRVTLHYEGKDGPVTETRSLWPAPEQGWGLRYFPKDMEPSDYVFPGCFRFTTYESFTPIALALDDPEAVAPDVISVRFTIDGREIDPDTVTYSAWEEENAYFGPGTFYYARFVFPRPDWAPEEGVLHVTVTEYLVNFGEIIVIERDYPYSEEPSDLG